jgi:dTDP-4-amino-4,6-dideoxygalactose transaminase
LNEKISSVVTPFVPQGYTHVFHQYTVRVEKHREKFSSMLSELGIGNSVYYPTQVHKLPSFDLEFELKHTEDATMQVLSLPVHPSLSKRNLNRIVDAVNRVGESL